MLALALGQPPGDRISLTDIRGLGVNTTQQAKQIADFLVHQQLLQPVGETLFEVRETVRQRFTLSAETSTPQVAPHVTPQVTPQVAPQVFELLKAVAGEMTRQELMDLAGLKDRKHFTDAYLQPALESGLLEMTIGDKPQSSKQRYRLTAQGQAAVAKGDT